ncbi:MAG: DinB family protein [Acidobacteria bacterium]|nr:DinB family protein [Acidobacteriota bacterium]
MASPLIVLLDEAFVKQAWHGPNLRGSLRGVTAEQAAWRPAPKRHNIWEIAVHCAYWKYVVRRRLTGDKRGSFPLTGSNWFVRDGEGDWAADVRLLQEQHELLREAALTSNNERLIRGAAMHDVYHAGHNTMFKRLMRDQ